RRGAVGAERGDGVDESAEPGAPEGALDRGGREARDREEYRDGEGEGRRHRPGRALEEPVPAVNTPAIAAAEPEDVAGQENGAGREPEQGVEGLDRVSGAADEVKPEEPALEARGGRAAARVADVGGDAGGDAHFGAGEGCAVEVPVDVDGPRGVHRHPARSQTREGAERGLEGRVRIDAHRRGGCDR